MPPMLWEVFDNDTGFWWLTFEPLKEPVPSIIRPHNDQYDPWDSDPLDTDLTLLPDAMREAVLAMREPKGVSGLTPEEMERRIEELHGPPSFEVTTTTFDERTDAAVRFLENEIIREGVKCRAATPPIHPRPGGDPFR